MTRSLTPSRPANRRARRLAWSAVIFAFVLATLFVYMATLSADVDGPLEYDDPVAVVAWGLLVVMYPILGAVVASRHPRNAIGWMFCASGIAVGLSMCAQLYAEYDLFGRSGSLPGGEVAWWLSVLLFPVGLFVTPIFLLLLFPTGKPASRFWGYVARAGALIVVLGLMGQMFLPGIIGPPSFGVENPFGVGGFLGDVVSVLSSMSEPLAIPFFLLAVGSVVSRMRHSKGDERQQLKWFGFVGIFIAIALALSFTFSAFSASTLSDIFFVLGGLGLLSLPVASAVAILKYRLYDIDVVINKTIVFGVLAAFITGIYVAIVVGIGTLLGSQDEPNLALSIAATAVVAIAFSPVKERTQRLANRLVYGHRLSPYEVMSDLSRTVATAPTPSDVLKAVAKAATFGVNAGTAAVTLHLHEGGSVSFTFPEGADVSTEERSSWPVSHRGEVLGELAITKQRSDPVTPHDRALLGDLATHAGLALHNARLAFELEARLKEISSQAEKLQSSRARIVSAADDSRRRLERDITQGPRQDLVALSARLDDAKRLMGVDPEAAATLLETITLDTNAALDALRELARGIYPPLLADKGIVAALEAHVSKHDLDVRIEAGEAVRDERFDDHVETTIYFCCIEALRDVQSGCSVWIDKQGERFFVEANPVLLDAKAAAAIEDRIEAIGGRFSFQSDVGEGKARMSIDALALEVA